jgi:hypothetical protein
MIKVWADKLKAMQLASASLSDVIVRVPDDGFAALRLLDKIAKRGPRGLLEGPHKGQAKGVDPVAYRNQTTQAGMGGGNPAATRM